MQRLFFLSIIGLLLAGLLLLPSQPASEAQGDQTPTPDRLRPTATFSQPPTPGIDNQAVVVNLPFNDTFDIANNWQPTANWQFIQVGAYNGTGWWLDIRQRETISTLTHRQLINLSGALSAQLVYRQRGALPDSDFIAVDVSLDGGQTWISVDQQLNLETPWELHLVDLTPFRGQVIQIRFRANTGTIIPQDFELNPDNNTDDETSDETEGDVSTPIENEIGVGYWIDDLSIQYVLNSPSFVYRSDHAGPHTTMGLHIVVGARREPIIDFVRRLRDAGYPLGTIKGTSSTEDILNEVAEISPETIIVYRSLLTPLGMRDCPDTSNNPVDEAAAWLNGVRPYWDSVNADYYELMNECWPPVDWLISFTVEAMRLSAAQGECLLVFSFGVGNPEPYEYVQLRPIYEYALQNPCQPGRYHGVALHAYGLTPDTLLSESGIYLGYRHRIYYTMMVPNLPEMVQIPVYLTEAGTGDGINRVECPEAARDIVQYTRQLELDPYIQGFHFWNLGPGTQWVDYTDCLPAIGDALLRYYAQY